MLFRDFFIKLMSNHGDYLKNILVYEFCHLKYKTNCRSLYDMVKKYSQNFDKYEYILKVA